MERNCFNLQHSVTVCPRGKLQQFRDSAPCRPVEACFVLVEVSEFASDRFVVISRAQRAKPRLHCGTTLVGHGCARVRRERDEPVRVRAEVERSEEHTSELQSHSDLVCRLLLEKKNKT